MTARLRNSAGLASTFGELVALLRVQRRARIPLRELAGRDRRISVMGPRVQLDLTRGEPVLLAVLSVVTIPFVGHGLLLDRADSRAGPRDTLPRFFGGAHSLPRLAAKEGRLRVLPCS